MSVVLQYGFALVAILGAAVLFTNAVEILGGGLSSGRGPWGAFSRRWGRRCPRP